VVGRPVGVDGRDSRRRAYHTPLVAGRGSPRRVGARVSGERDDCYEPLRKSASASSSA
jgi:hypothetical protein